MALQAVLVFLITCLIFSLLSFPCCYCSSSHASPPSGDLAHKAASPYDPPSSFEDFVKTRELHTWPWRKLGSKVGGGRALASVETMINVNDYGAKGDGSDGTKAFQKAWEAVCSSQQVSVLVVPKNNNYLLSPITFQGPCKSKITVQIYGTLQASADRSAYSKDLSRWLAFENVQNLWVQGGGVINGNGKTWWANSCKTNSKLPCKKAPTALTFYKCKNLVVKNLKIQNSQQMHVSFEESVGVQASGLNIIAPANSPNTDGIHVASTQNINISNSFIATGDDCISIVSGSQKVQVSGVTCGPGHGISIGSLGSGDSEADVSDVIVTGATLSGTTNGVRIKTWQGGSGSAKDIKFRDIVMHNVENPIIIDQTYCDQSKPCKSQSSAVQVQNVLYHNITGTSSSNDAVTLNCSEKFPCQEIVLEDIDLKVVGGKGAKAMCTNARVTQNGDVSPNCAS